MSSLKFGTSGLRGLVTDLVGWPSYAYARAFFRAIAATTGGNRQVLIGRDLRDSSAGIAATVADAAAEAGFEAVDLGALPTPALALEGFRLGACAVMVTGSHIPQDRNGLKFYRPDGEITKADEAAILAALGDVGAVGAMTAAPATPERGALDRYRRRYGDVFPADALKGARIAVYQQSSVARDLLTDLLADLGAEIVPIGRSETFVPIDTEAHRPEDIAFIRAVMAAGTYDALVTTDGDADRPLVADGTGRIVRGDVLGLITARFLGADAVVVPVTAGSAIEHAGGFRRVLRTRVGSPFVIAGMAQAQGEGAAITVGFEANGGFLLGSDVTIDGRTLPALPTRDAMLPILATLASARKAGLTLADLVASLNAGETASDRLPEVPSERSGPFLQQLGQDAFRQTFFRPVGTPLSVDTQDGSASSSTAPGPSISAPPATRPSCAATPRPDPSRTPRNWCDGAWRRPRRPCRPGRPIPGAEDPPGSAPRIGRQDRPRGSDRGDGRASDGHHRGTGTLLRRRPVTGAAHGAVSRGPQRGWRVDARDTGTRHRDR